jgi:putative hemolysin
MVPRSRVVALPRDSSSSEVQQLLLEEGRSRMPVYERDLDRIVGYVVARDVRVGWQQELIVLEDILRPVYTIAERPLAIDVLREMQRRRTQIAIVIDEQGGLAGLVTVEDLIEELVGDILSEHEDPTSVATRPTAPQWCPDGLPCAR